jgi:hypothetical protein
VVSGPSHSLQTSQELKRKLPYFCRACGSFPEPALNHFKSGPSISELSTSRRSGWIGVVGRWQCSIQQSGRDDRTHVANRMFQQERRRGVQGEPPTGHSNHPDIITKSLDGREDG